LYHSPDQVWFPGEKICPRHKPTSNKFWRIVKLVQRAINRHLQKKPEIRDYFWTAGMLYAHSLYGTKYKGIRPDDGDFTKMLRGWFKRVVKYPRTKQLYQSRLKIPTKTH